LILDYLKSKDPKLDLTDKEVQKQAEALQKEIPFTYKKISSYENKIKEILEKSPPEYTALSPVFIPTGPSKKLPPPSSSSGGPFSSFFGSS